MGAYLIRQQVRSRDKPFQWEGQAISSFLAHPLTALAHFLRHDRRGDDRLLLLNLELQPADIFLQLSDQPVLFVGQLRQLELSVEVLEIGLEFRLVVPRPRREWPCG